MLDWFASLGFGESLLMIIGVGLICATFVWWYFTVKENMAGGSKTRAAGILRRHAALRGSKVLNSVTLEGKNGPTHADHVLVGYFGVLVMNVIGEVGSYYGDDQEENWTIVPKEGAKHHIPNPLRENEAFIEALRGLLVKNELYKIPTEQLVIVLPSFNDKREFGIRQNLPVLNVRKLASRLATSHFEKDNGVDVEKLCALITQAAEQ